MAVGQWVKITSGSDLGRVAVIHQRLVVGRACVGIPAHQRLRLDDPAISRDHLELTIDPNRAAWLVDTSTNGTRVNGAPVLRGERVPLHNGAVIELGDTSMAFGSADMNADRDELLRSTITALHAGTLTLAVDDPLKDLSEREQQILALIAQGHSNLAIANRLSLSSRTVESHVRHAMSALRLPDSSDVNRRVQLVLTYLRAMVDSEASAG